MSKKKKKNKKGEWIVSAKEKLLVVLQKEKRMTDLKLKYVQYSSGQLLLRNETLLINRKKKNRKRVERRREVEKNRKEIQANSSGEPKIKSFLERNEYTFYQEYEFPDCINPKTNKVLRFDFFLSKNNICIEYDGKQHFEIVPKIHGDDPIKARIKLKAQKYRDEIKTDYCKRKNIKLIRIPYKKYFEINQLLAKNLSIENSTEL